MPIPMLTSTSELLGPNAGKCESRSLCAERFPDPQAKDSKDATPRKDWFKNLICKRVNSLRPSPEWLPSNGEALHARLMSRMMVNLAGGVMENANLLFDRYGYPTIPGSAVKGCARRMALHALHDWIEAGSERPAEDDACAPCCERFEKPADMLAAIARVFGWVKGDWTAEKNRDKETKLEITWKSDFAWVCGGNLSLLAEARNIVGSSETFAGTVAFLPALPNRDPGLELDVLTPHHRKYYQGELPVATDTEDPVPVYFPTIKPQSSQDYFTFPLIPLRRIVEDDLTTTKKWLGMGLELFGLGAKTNAGYGWFDASEEIQESVSSRRARLRADEKLRREKEDQDAAERVVAAARRERKEAEEAATAGFSADEKEAWKVAQLSDGQFDSKVRAFFKEPKKGGPNESEKKAIISALRGSRIHYWQEFKTKAIKGDLAKSEQAIRALNRQLSGDKMP